VIPEGERRGPSGKTRKRKREVAENTSESLKMRLITVTEGPLPDTGGRRLTTRLGDRDIKWAILDGTDIRKTAGGEERNLSGGGGGKIQKGSRVGTIWRLWGSRRYELKRGKILWEIAKARRETFM